MNLKTKFNERDILYYFAFIFIFYIILSNMMILRAHLYLSLVVAVVVSYYTIKYVKQEKFFD